MVGVNKISFFFLFLVVGSIIQSSMSKSNFSTEGRSDLSKDTSRLTSKKSSSNLTFPYDWSDLRKYLFYAYAAFCFDDLKDWSCYWCLSKNVTGMYPQVNVTVPAVVVDTILENDGLYGTYGYTGASSEAIIISFRGTSSIGNWINDLEFWMSDYPAIPGAQVHYGFLETYTAIQMSLRSSLKKLRTLHPKLPILITGHSLGAAQSVLAAMDLALNGFSNITLLNFGQPRVGNAIFSAAVASLLTEHYRVVNMFDIVPHFPFQYKIQGYEHHPQEIWFQNNGYQFKVCSSSIGEDPTCADSLEPWQYLRADHTQYLAISQNLQDGHGCGAPPF